MCFNQGRLMLPRLGFTVTLIGFLGLVSLGSSSVLSAQTSSSEEDWNYGFELFQYLLQQENLEPTSSIRSALSAPQSSVIVLIGEFSAAQVASRTDLADFVKQGGMLMLSPDKDFDSAQLGKTKAGPVQSTNNSIMYMNYEDCLQITDFATHPLTRDLNLIITNRSGWVADKGLHGTWTSLMYLPDKCSPHDASGKSIATVSVFQSAKKSGVDGGVFLLADPSIVSNGMIWFGDNGMFAHRIAKYLANPGRHQLCMYVDAKPMQKIQLKSESDKNPPSAEETKVTPPQPKLETLLDVANAAISELANADRINEQLKNQPRRFQRDKYAWTIWIALASASVGLIALLLLKRSARMTRYHRSQTIVTGQSLLRQTFPMDVSNRIASELLAREFCRIWSGRQTESEWRQCLDELKQSNRDKLSAKDRTLVESILAIAVFGGRNGMSDGELQEFSRRINDLVLRFRTASATPI
jgi:hypothetical protein